MTNETFFGCHYTEVWASPSDWKTTTSKKSLTKQWYVQCIFYDPEHAYRYPKGFQFRKRLNKYNTLEKRRQAITMLLQEIPKLLSEQGFNPITKVFMIPQEIERKQNNGPANTHTPLPEALEFARQISELSHHTKQDIKSVLKYFSESAQKLHLDTLEIGQVKALQLKMILDNIYTISKTFTDKRYNKYLGYISGLMETLVTYEVLEYNPVARIKKKRTETALRQTLTSGERKKVYNYLKDNYPRFWLFMVIFFHSGGREIELLNLKYEDIDICNLRYKSLIKKGGQHKWVMRPIKQIAVPYWEMALRGAKKGQYIFSVGLLPGENPIRRDQISKRWRVHVKTKLGITADFYALKHSNLDELTASKGMEAAAAAAGHTTTEMVRKHYAVNQGTRDMIAVQQAQNHFVPIKKEPS